MIGRVYSASFSAVAVSAIQDIFEINAPSTSVVVLLSCEVGQFTDYGNAEAEGLRMQIQRSTGTSGSGGTTLVARPHQPSSAAFAGSVEANNTTLATTVTPIRATPWNIQAGYVYQPTPEEYIYIEPSGRLVFTLPAAPADSLTMSGTVTFMVLG